MRSWVFAFAAAILVLFLSLSTTEVEAKTSTLVTVYQWWHPTLKNYYYGTEAETEAVEARGYVSKKFSFYVYSARVKGTYPLYRFANDHDTFISLYNKNKKELKMNLDKLLGYTYAKKHGNDHKKKSTEPVYEYYTGNGTSYYWTSNKQAGDASGYRFEYLAFYSAGTTPASVQSSIQNNLIVQTTPLSTTPSAVPSKSKTAPTPTKTPTSTPPISKTPAVSKTQTAASLASSSRTPTLSRTPSISHTRTASVTPTRTATPTVSISKTRSPTPPQSKTPAPSTTHTKTPVASQSAGGLPLTFNALDNWSLHGLGILNQGNCGSCYSFSAATVVSYRNMIGGYPITTNGIASPQSILDCGAGKVYGTAPCNGGFPYAAIQLAQTGLGTCSAAQACKAGCIPYCEPSCGINNSTCRNHCPAGGTGALVYATTPTVLYNSTKNPDGIKKELMTNGPTTAIFSVYKSWESFCYANKTGVFDAANLDTSVYLGGHAVVLVGWGRDLNGDYWIFQNSWGSGWGTSGFFYVRAGLNLMGIEGALYGTKYSATPTLKRRTVTREVTTLPATGVPVALDPAAPEVQSLGTFVGQQFAATSSSGFQFSAMQTVTSQVVAGTSFQVTIAGADGTLVSATVLTPALPEAAPELVSAAVVGKATPLSNGPATQGNPASLSGPSGDGAAAGGNGGGGAGGDGGAAAAGGLSGGAIAGAVVGSVLGAVLILGVVAGASFLAYKKFRSDKYDKQPKPQPVALAVTPEKSNVAAFLGRNHTAVDLSPKVDDSFRASITARNPNITDI